MNSGFSVGMTKTWQTMKTKLFCIGMLST